MATAASFPRRSESQTTLMFTASTEKYTVTLTRRNGQKIAVSSSVVPEHALLAIGDQNITEAARYARYNPHREHIVGKTQGEPCHSNHTPALPRSSARR
jgi:hypothetical protein